jgi:peroxiredoxin
MLNKHFIVAVLLVLVGWGCSSSNENKQAVISGNFSVADSIDASKDFSGIGLTITKKDSANAEADTLFHAITDSNGAFSGLALFREKGQYPLTVSRNGQNISRIGVILAESDSVEIDGQLPNLDETLSISSREHAAMETYNRLNRGFQRVARYIQAGKLTGDSLEQELNKWSDLYWSVYQDRKGTIASELSARESVRLLEGWNNKKMMKRIRSVQDVDALVDLGTTYGKNYIANSQGLNSTLAYLDTLSNITTDPDKSRTISMERIKLLYDSARINAAQKNLQAFQEKYKDNSSAKNWAESISYDLNYLSPGDSIPDFQFQQNGHTISRDSLQGTPYILEITRLSNTLYQQQFDRSVVIHSIYKNYGLQIVTLPLDENQVTIDAFFSERVKPWPVADANAFDRQKLLEKFNVRLIPTRFLIDKQGKIIRKYVGREYDDVINGIQTLIKQDKEPTS